MKNLLLVLLVFLLPVWSFGQEQSDEEYKLVTKYQVCQAFEDGEDCTLRAIESDQHIVFYMNDKSSWMGIITLNSLSQKKDTHP